MEIHGGSKCPRKKPLTPMPNLAGDWNSILQQVGTPNRKRDSPYIDESRESRLVTLLPEEKP